jgi:integral membrane protein
MQLQPKPADIPRIPGALKLYQVSSIITGVLLLLLCAEVIAKWNFGYELEGFGPNGIIALVPTDTVVAINLSTGLLIVHGWFYVLYLFTDFRLWSLMRWNFVVFLFIALGGIIPFLSFFLEVWVGRKVKAFLATQTTPDAAASEPLESHS